MTYIQTLTGKKRDTERCNYQSSALFKCIRWWKSCQIFCQCRRHSKMLSSSKDKVNKYNTNVKWAKYNFRAKVDMNPTSSTIMGLAMDGAIVEDRAPGFGTNNDALWAHKPI